MRKRFSPYILQCMRFQLDSTSMSLGRTVMDYEFDFCVNCERDMWLDGIYYRIDPGCFVIRKPGQKVRTQGMYDCYMLTLDFSDRSPSLAYSRNTATQKQALFDSEMWEILPSVFKPAHYDDYIRIFEALLSVNEMDINENKTTMLLVNELLHLLLSDAFCHLSSARTPRKTGIDEVCTYIRAHYMEDICLDKLSKVARLNKNYLVRQFKKALGISPIAYLIRIRMEHAAKLLEETDLPVKTVALFCGYSDPAFFHAYFKKTYLVSPLSYRRAKQGSTEAGKKIP